MWKRPTSKYKPPPRTGCRQEPLGTLGLGPGHGGEVAARELGRPRALHILDTE